MGISGTKDVCLVALTARADKRMLRSIRKFLCGTAKSLGIPKDDIIRLRLLIKEVCRYVIEQSFDPGDDGQFHMALWRRADVVELVVEDRGLPVLFDENAPLDRSQAPLLALRAFADEVKFHNLGKHGKRLEFGYRLDAETIEQIFAKEEPSALLEVTGHEHVTLRLMDHTNIIDVSRCIYRTYGLSYYRDYLYYPSKISALLEHGRLESCIAVTDSGLIAGHLAILYEGPDAKVCETAMAVVDPRFRGRRLFEKMKVMARQQAINRGLYGLYSDAVTVHPYSQMSNLALGARETGVMLAYLPDRMLFKSISDSETLSRQSNILFFLHALPIPPADVYVPEHHAAIIQEIYSRLNIARTYTRPGDDIFETVRGQKTQFNLQHKLETGLVFMLIRHYGSDVLLVVHNHLRDLRQTSGVACIYLDLPLRHPLTAVICKGMESFGFFFCGVLIEYDQGNVLRLQYMNNIKVNVADIKVASDFGRRLLDYVLKQQELVTHNAI